MKETLTLILHLRPRICSSSPVQTRMQILASPTAAAYTSVLDALSTIRSREGARSLFRGIASVIAGAGPAHAIYFGTYEVVKDATGGNREGHQWASTAFAGASATIASELVMNPFDGECQKTQTRNKGRNHSEIWLARNLGLIFRVATTSAATQLEHMELTLPV